MAALFFSKSRNRVECLTVSTKCSIKQLYDVISGLDENKRALVKSIGFDGILMFPSIRQVNRKFAAWIMSCVDPLSMTLKIDECKRIPFNKDDVSLVFGIPSCGISVADNGIPRKDTVVNIKQRYLGIDGKDNRSIKAAREVVERVYTSEMTDEDKDAFKVAFVIYVMATLLSPGAKFDYAAVDYWNALTDPSTIHMFDWSEYVIKKLLDAVVKAKSDLNDSTKVPIITGCNIFLQVLYLDSIDVGTWNMEHNVFPRFRLFNSERMKSMILADTIPRLQHTSYGEFGMSNLRNPDSVCYYWGSLRTKEDTEITASNSSALFEATNLLATTLCAPDEAAGPLYVAISEYDSQKNRASRPSGIMVISALLSIIHAYRRGFIYNFGVDSNGQVKGNNLHTDRQLQEDIRGKRKVHSSIDQNNKLHDSLRNRKKCRSCGCCFQSCLIDCSEDFPSYECSDIASCLVSGEAHHLSGTSATDLTCTQRFVSSSMAKFYLGARCKKLGGHGMNNLSSNSCRSSFASIQDGNISGYICPNTSCHLRSPQAKINTDPLALLNRPWVIHYTPKYIEVIGTALKLQLTSKSEMEMDLFDAILRRFKHADDKLYHCCSRPRWRHFVESDFKWRPFLS